LWWVEWWVEFLILNIININQYLKNTEWRRSRDSNPGKTFTFVGFQDRCIQPLCHSSD
jgi:hypothetical protein